MPRAHPLLANSRSGTSRSLKFRLLTLEHVDWAIAVALFAEVELQLWLGPAQSGRVAAAFGAAVFTIPVAFRRRWPLCAMLVIVAVLAGKTILDHHTGPVSNLVGIFPALVLLVYAVGAFAPPRRSWLVVALTIVVSSINTLTTTGKSASSIPAGVIVVTLLPYALGRMMRRRGLDLRSEREQAERLDAERDQLAEAAAYRERSRIARELHDVITHSVSVMVIYAGGARMVMSSDPGRAEASLRSVERAGREALAEMRRLLGVLDVQGDSLGLTPQPRLADLDELIGRARSSGLKTEVHVDGEQVALSRALDLCAYRIVQEALTNAIKHAAPARADVRIRWHEDSLELEISDSGRGVGAAPVPSSGHGIIGMRERVALHGGSIRTGPGPTGGFSVLATLPLVAEPA